MKLKAMSRRMQVGIGLPLPSLIRRIFPLFSLIIVLLETFFVILQKIYAVRAGRGAYSGSVLDKIIKKKIYIYGKGTKGTDKTFGELQPVV